MRTAPAVVALVLAAVTLSAQEKPQPRDAPKEPAPAAAPKPSQERELIPLKVQFVLSRLKAEKKLSSLPYSMIVTANEPAKTSLRMGVEVPIAATGSTGGGYTYRSVGTNIDCTASGTRGGNFKLAIAVFDSSIHVEAGKPEATPTYGTSAAPAFRTFNSSFTVLLRDGQTTTFTSAVDPVSGEVMKIDVSLDVVK